MCRQSVFFHLPLSWLSVHKSIHSGHAALQLLCNYYSSNLWTTDAWDSANCHFDILRFITASHAFALEVPGNLKLTIDSWMKYIFHIWERACMLACVHVHAGGGFIPCGRVMQAPSTIACASSRSLHSAARAAALSASQISFRPSKAGAVSQNSSLLLLSWPSVIGYSLFHFGRSFLRGSLRPDRKNEGMLSLTFSVISGVIQSLWHIQGYALLDSHANNLSFKKMFNFLCQELTWGGYMEYESVWVQLYV